MNKIWSGLRLAVCSTGITLVAGCGIGMFAPVIPPHGAVYNNTKAPLNIDINNTEMGSKQGEASVICILGLVSTGDASIAEAAKNGEITTVQHADYRYFNILGVYQKYTTIVTGE